MRILLGIIVASVISAPLSAQAVEGDDPSANSIAAPSEIMPSNWTLERTQARKKAIPRRGGAVAQAPASTARAAAKPRIYGGVNVRSGKRQKGRGNVGVAIPF